MAANSPPTTDLLTGSTLAGILDESAAGGLIAAAGLRILDTFLSDGREGDLNLYAIMAG